MQRTMIILLLALLAVGCVPREPKHGVGDVIRWEVQGETGTGVIVRVSARYENDNLAWYYEVDIGVNSKGERELMSFHEALVGPPSAAGKAKARKQSTGRAKLIGDIASFRKLKPPESLFSLHFSVKGCRRYMALEMLSNSAIVYYPGKNGVSADHAREENLRILARHGTVVFCDPLTHSDIRPFSPDISHKDLVDVSAWSSEQIADMVVDTYRTLDNVTNECLIKARVWINSTSQPPPKN